MEQSPALTPSTLTRYFATAVGRLIEVSADTSVPTANRAATQHQPAAVVRPRSRDEVKATLVAAEQHGVGVTVVGGAHSAFCLAPGAIAIEMGTHFGQAHAGRNSDGSTTIVCGGGVRMFDLMTAAQDAGVVVPVGRSDDPGLGLALHGGMGGLSRHLGLTLDRITAIELILPTGDLCRVTRDSTGLEGELWWGLRGAGAQFGVVTQIEFAVEGGTRAQAIRSVCSPGALASVLSWAHELPREWTTSISLGHSRSGEAEMRFDVMSLAGGSANLSGLLKESAVVVPEARTEELVFDYPDQPDFNVPHAEPDPSLEIVGENTSGYLVNSDPDSERLADVALEMLSQAPNQQCQIQFQQLGGAIADLSPTQTSYWNRHASWSMPVLGPHTDGDKAAVDRWVESCPRRLGELTGGFYVVDVDPTAAESKHQVELAFGDNLPRLRALKGEVDPSNLLSHYYEL